MRISGLVLLFGIAVMAFGPAAGCKSDAQAKEKLVPPFAPVGTADNATIIIDGFQFTPSVLLVPVGTNVTWINKYPLPHRVNSDNASNNFTSPSLTTGLSFTWVFDTTGTFTYYCANHPTMKGTIEVRNVVKK